MLKPWCTKTSCVLNNLIATIVSIAQNKDISSVHTAIVWSYHEKQVQVAGHVIMMHQPIFEQTSIVSPDQRIISFSVQFIAQQFGNSYANWYIETRRKLVNSECYDLLHLNIFHVVLQNVW